MNEVETKEEILFIQNNGNTLTYIDNIQLSSDNISIIKNIKNPILPCELIDFKIKYKPTKNGWNFDTLAISLKEQNNIIKYYFEAYLESSSNVEESQLNSEIMIYPNPATEKIILKTSLDIKKIQVKDLIGKIEFENQYFSAEDLEIELTNLTSGIKILVIYTNDKIITKKIIKVK